MPRRRFPRLLRALEPARYDRDSMGSPTRRRLSAGVVLLVLTGAAVGHADNDMFCVTRDNVTSCSNVGKAKKGAKLFAKSKKLGATPAMPSDTSPERFTRYDAHIREASSLYQIPEELVRAVIKVESDFDPRSVSRADARGLMQLIPETATRMMVTDIMDPRQNILGGVRYLRVLANTFNGNLELTIAAYNAGEGAVVRYGGIPPYEETQGYVVRVLTYYRAYRALSMSLGG